MSPKHDYWFAAKRYGWGWGLPVRWEGWATLIAYFVLLGLVVFGFRPEGHPVAFTVLVGVLTAAFVAVCWVKGEPARWRWGKD